MLICMVKTPFIWFCVCIWPDCSAERQWAEVHTFLLRIWRVRHFAKRTFSERNDPLIFAWKQSENSPKTVRDLCRKWACYGRFDAAKRAGDTAKNTPEMPTQMLKIYEQVWLYFCEKIGEKSLNFMKSRVNYVQNAQKTMWRNWRTPDLRFDKTASVC